MGEEVGCVVSIGVSLSIHIGNPAAIVKGGGLFIRLHYDKGWRVLCANTKLHK